MLPGDNMFGGFDPTQPDDRWFERHRGAALLLALLAHALLAGVVIYLELHRDRTTTEEVVLDDPEIENFDVDEEMEIEEEEPEPEPEPEKPRPRPQQEIRNVDEQTSEVVETDVAPQREEVPDDAYDARPVEETKKAAEEKPVEDKKPKKKKTFDIGDREAPRVMPADGTPPRPEKTNASPAYPESLRKKNVTGQIKVKLKIYMDGSVRGMKVLKKDVKGTDDPSEIARAEKLFLKAVVAAVKTWKFTPAKLKGKTITVWWPVTIPFRLG